MALLFDELEVFDLEEILENGNTFGKDIDIERKEGTLRGIDENGNEVFINTKKAYFQYRLTMEDLFTVEDCDEVLKGMERFKLVSCEDAQAIIQGEPSEMFTIDDVKTIREQFEAGRM